jgi:anti-sigma B factor antagonist
MNFEYRTEKKSDINLFYFKGELIDKDQSTDLMNAIEKYIQNGENKFALDLSELSYMNSSGLNILITILTKARKSGGEVAICNVTQKVKQLLVITKLNSVFNVSESLEEAMNKLK